MIFCDVVLAWCGKAFQLMFISYGYDGSAYEETMAPLKMKRSNSHQHPGSGSQ